MQKKSFKYAYFCQSCRQEIELHDQVFFVEEKGKNFFCSEDCIQDFYGPIAQFYYQKHLKLRDPHDIPEQEFESYDRYGNLCLQKPKEVWQDESDAEETYYYYISEYSDVGGVFYYIVMCFCLEGEPTFILLSAPTRDKNLVEAYRKGKKVHLHMEELELKTPVEQGTESGILSAAIDERGMALMEEMLKNRSKGDIKLNDFEEHSYLLDETIENPDEAWEMESLGKEDTLLTLITHHDEKLHYIVICSLDAGDDHNATWRVLYHFPTGDIAMVERYRRGIPRDGIGAYSIIH